MGSLLTPMSGQEFLSFFHDLTSSLFFHSFAFVVVFLFEKVGKASY